MDKANAVSVQMTNGTLSSCTEAELLNGANAAVLGDEIIQFQTATLTGPGLYTLSNLLRGRRGTESATATHLVGEPFVRLQAESVAFVPCLLEDRNRAYTFRALSAGQNLSDANDHAFTFALKTLCPLAPVQIKGTRSLGIGSDLTLSWVRRARKNAAWVDGIDVPLDETQESFAVDIMNGNAVVRTFDSLASASATYTAAQQTTDWGASVPSTFTVKIYQISARYGRGTAATADI